MAGDTADEVSPITGRSGTSLIFTPPSKDRLYTVLQDALSARPVSAFRSILANRARFIHNRT